MRKIVGYSNQPAQRCEQTPFQTVRKVRSCATVFLVLLLGAGAAPRLMSQPPSDAFEIGQGVMIDPGRRLAYVMAPGGGLEAVDLVHGSVAWSTDQAAKPLALVGDFLVSQTQAGGEESRLEIVTLNVADSGRRVVGNTVSLPANVRVSINQTLTGSFTAQAHAVGQEVYVTWKYTFRPRGGAWVPDKPVGERDSDAPSDALQESSGTVLMNISSGALTPMRPEDLPEAAIPRPLEPAPTDLLVDVPQPQYLSADGKHLLTSERIADDRVWEKYHWTVYDRATGNTVGSTNKHLSRAPFVVIGSLIVFQTGPFVRQTRQTLVDEPLKIRAVNLSTGQEVWNREVRDTKYRGPFPP